MPLRPLTGIILDGGLSLIRVLGFMGGVAAPGPLSGSSSWTTRALVYYINRVSRLVRLAPPSGFRASVFRAIAPDLNDWLTSTVGRFV